MNKERILKCYIEGNQGIAVLFPIGQTEITISAPCKGCCWRTIVQRKPEFEELKDLGEVITSNRLDEWSAYQDKLVSLSHGSMEPEDTLVLTEYPNLLPGQIGNCCKYIKGETPAL